MATAWKILLKEGYLIDFGLRDGGSIVYFRNSKVSEGQWSLPIGQAGPGRVKRTVERTTKGIGGEEDKR